MLIGRTGSYCRCYGLEEASLVAEEDTEEESEDDCIDIVSAFSSACVPRLLESTGLLIVVTGLTILILRF